MKSLLLKKGWAGKTITRHETVDRVNPLLRRHHEINFTYDSAIARLKDQEVVDRLNGFQHIARADAGKMSETVLSCGGVPESGVDMEPGDFDPGDDQRSILTHLIEREQAFLDAIAAEKKIEHQMRTRAILEVVTNNTRQRLDYLNSIRT